MFITNYTSPHYEPPKQNHWIPQSPDLYGVHWAYTIRTTRDGCICRIVQYLWFRCWSYPPYHPWAISQSLLENSLLLWGSHELRERVGRAEAHIALNLLSKFFCDYVANANWALLPNKKSIFVVPLHSRSRWNKLTTMNSPCSLELPLFLLSPKISRFSGTPIIICSSLNLK